MELKLLTLAQMIHSLFAWPEAIEVSAARMTSKSTDYQNIPSGATEDYIQVRVHSSRPIRNCSLLRNCLLVICTLVVQGLQPPQRHLQGSLLGCLEVWRQPSVTMSGVHPDYRSSWVRGTHFQSTHQMAICFVRHFPLLHEKTVRLTLSGPGRRVNAHGSICMFRSLLFFSVFSFEAIY